ncbi:MAG: hypothetical protein JNL70_01555 [Saprospiraceae bacterium]|nr:hypothetical protein [Saprospiraceae bacterium]
MKRNVLFLLTLAYLGVFFNGCMPPRTAILTPQIPEKYLDKDGFAMQKSDSIDVTFGYLFSTQDYLVFEVSVKNNSTDSAYVDASQFTYYAASAKDTSHQIRYFKAHSIDQITEKLKERVRERNVKTAILVLATVAAVAAVESKSQKNRSPRYRDYSWSIRTGVDLSFNYFDAVMFSQLTKKEARKGLEKSVMLPKKIGAGETHIGAVYFPRFDAAKELTFNFYTEGRDFVTIFKQKLQ